MPKKFPFNIPAINNQKLALMRHLKLDDEDDAAHEQVKELEGFKLDTDAAGYVHTVSVFEFSADRYHVASITTDMEADVVQEFNSNLWKIRKLAIPEADSATHQQSTAATNAKPPLGTRSIDAKDVKQGMWIDRDNPRFNARVVDVTTTRDGQIKLSTDFGNGGEPASEWYEPRDKLRIIPA